MRYHISQGLTVETQTITGILNRHALSQWN